MAGYLAELMAHKEDTAAKYYRLSKKGIASVKASQALHAMMRKRSHKPSSSIEMETTTDLKEKPEGDLLEIADNGMTEGD